LSLLLNDALGPVLAAGGVDRGAEADDRHRTRVAHINADEHGALGELLR
jgi:hypothetical protein